MSDELLDVLDEHGNPTGKTATQARAHSIGLWHRAVHVAITDGNGTIMIQQRAESKKDHPGVWDSIHGGHLRQGESIIDGAIRELQEELGIRVAPSQLDFLFEAKRSSRRPGTFKQELNPVYLLELDQDTRFTFDDREVAAVRWLTLEELEAEIASSRILTHNDEEARIMAAIRERLKAK